MSLKLSIIIPAYNVEKYLPNCLDSVLKQDNGNIEFIIVDDGSRDSTPNVAKQYSAKYEQVRYFRKENGGPSAARNFAIERARGDYILFLDSDDQLADDAVSSIFERLNETGPDVLIGRYCSFYDSSTDAFPCEYQLDREIIRKYRGEKLLEYLVQDKTYDWYSWLYVIKADLIQKHDLYFEEGVDFAEDARLVPKILLVAKNIDYLDKPFYLYRRNRIGSITATFSKKYFQGKLDYLSFLQRFCEENRITEAVRTKLFANMANMYVSTLFDAWYFPAEERNAYLNELRPYKFILKHSVRKYHHLLFVCSSLVGMKLISFILYLRAASIRERIQTK